MNLQSVIGIAHDDDGRYSTFYFVSAVLSVWYGYLAAKMGSFVGTALLHVLHNVGASLAACAGLAGWGEYPASLGCLLFYSPIPWRSLH